MNEDLLKLNKICGKAYRKAKNWYQRYVGCQIMALFFAISTFGFDYGAKISALITLFGVFASEFCRWRSDVWKSNSDWAKGRLEVVDGFGVSVDKEELRDWLADCPENFLDDVTDDEIRGSEFASKEPPGPRRAVENTRESAWWSKFLARKMILYLSLLLLFFLVGGFFALMICICELKSADAKQGLSVVQTVGCIICSVWAFILSINALRLIFDYFSFAREADEILHRCKMLLKSGNLSVQEASATMHDYQTARSARPLMPTFVWRWHKKHLNHLWKEFSSE